MLREPGRITAIAIIIYMRNHKESGYMQTCTLQKKKKRGTYQGGFQGFQETPCVNGC